MLFRLSLSIRMKILLGCMCLAGVTLLVGLLSTQVQQKLSNNTIEIYDQSFQSMNYLRLGQTILVGISRDLALGGKAEAVYADQLASAEDAVKVARRRAMTPAGRQHADHLVGTIAAFRTAFQTSAIKPNLTDFHAAESAFDTTIAIFAADGFRLRRDAEYLIEAAQIQTNLALVGAFLAALLITWILRRAVVPPIQRAVTIAKSIADGHLDNEIKLHGRSETSVLMRALATMQASIADKIGKIETLSARQASGYRAQIDLQHARFQTALDNMTIGLCMFDADGALLVRNRRYVEMFGDRPAADWLRSRRDAMGSEIEWRELDGVKKTCIRTLRDGRIILISEEMMTSGGCVVVYEDVTERHTAEEHLKQLVRHDHLTGLANRFHFRELLEAYISGRNDRRLAVLCLDLDRFKIINDTLGHLIGDALLCEVARRLQDTIGESETVFRFGGDEFAVICRDFEDDQAPTRLADRIIQAFVPCFVVDKHDVSVGVSIGIASAITASATPETLLKQADLALYEVKAEGRGSYRHFEGAMDLRIQLRRQMEVDLRIALREQQFEIHYQPIIDIGRDSVASCEALLRWRHPEKGLIPPSDFIPIAEETGLIVQIGRWVLEEACREATKWPSDVKVAVNLSPLQFRSLDLLDEVREALGWSGLDARRLDLEITESLMLQNTPLTFEILHGLQELGISISMDDFGTGYSSLSYLRQFPFDKIKIDRCFVQDLVDCGDGLSIVRSVVQLGHSLRMRVVAEGVETQEQVELLKAAGCQELQGYYLSRPLPAYQLASYLQSAGNGNAPATSIRRSASVA